MPRVIIQDTHGPRHTTIELSIFQRRPFSTRLVTDASAGDVSMFKSRERERLAVDRMRAHAHTPSKGLSEAFPPLARCTMCSVSFSLASARSRLRGTFMPFK